MLCMPPVTIHQTIRGDGSPHHTRSAHEAPLRRMSDRANGGHQEKFQDDGPDIELSGLIDSAARSDPIPNGQHGGIKYGPAPAGGGVLHAAVDRLRQLLGGGDSKAAAWAGGFSPVGSEEPDSSDPGATQGVSGAAATLGIEEPAQSVTAGSPPA